MADGEGGLPLTRDVAFVHVMTWLVAALLLGSSALGLGYGRQGWYDPDAGTLPALLGQDAITLLVGLPLLLGSAWLARRGSLRGLLAWMGALFYVAYSYSFYVIGIRFNAFFLGHVAIVSMGMYGTLALLFSVDLEAVKARFAPSTPTRLVAGFLIGMCSMFAVMWVGMTLSHLATGRELGAVPRVVISVDGVVLLPLMFVGGLSLWRQEALGYALGGLLLVKVAATFLTLVVNTVVVLQWGETVDGLETLLYAVGMVGAGALLVRFLRCVVPAPPG